MKTLNSQKSVPAIFISRSEKETKKIAGQIFKRYQNFLNSDCLIFALQGELGAGKTQFAKGLALKLGIEANIRSPSFVLVREYPYQLNTTSGIFYHVDAWRMEKGRELLGVGFKEMLHPGNIITIEWAKKVKPILKKLEQNYPPRWGNSPGVVRGNAKVIWLKIETLSPTKRRIKYQA